SSPLIRSSPVSPLFPYTTLFRSFLFLRVLRCFTSPGSLRPAMDSPTGARASPLAGCPIRTSPDQRLLAAPRGVSALAPSFFGLRSEEHTSELQSREKLVCRLLLE